ncbi:hypothetical protein [Sphingomonas sp. Leaf37]|uniref:hypothetical protein n=1 Tax=Sphingomonas sp. Leaf37 TaxID=2876552 RepID=UPI001E4FBB1F|nr:hypothetical protein [Sphingomonas sp. Leaf37]
MRTYLDSLQRAADHQRSSDLERAIANAPTEAIRDQLSAILPKLPKTPTEAMKQILITILEDSVARRPNT